MNKLVWPSMCVAMLVWFAFAPVPWVAADDQTIARGDESTRILISAIGDCTLGGDPRNGGLSRFASQYKRKGAQFFFKKVHPVLSQDDLTIANLEGTFTNATRYVSGKRFCFRGKPAYAAILTHGSVEACNLSNNHMKDFYDRGYRDTMDTLDARSIAHFGWGKTTVYQAKGKSIGLCGFSLGASKSAVRRVVQELRLSCDLVIASFHWGAEMVGAPNATQRGLGREAVKAGADLVLGHHPHVVGGIENYKGKYIVYSLGNFCFGGNSNPKDKDTFIFQQSFEFSELGAVDAGIRVIPCSVSTSSSSNTFQPKLLSGSNAKRVYQKIEKASVGLNKPAKIR